MTLGLIEVFKVEPDEARGRALPGWYWWSWAEHGPDAEPWSDTLPSPPRGPFKNRRMAEHKARFACPGQPVIPRDTGPDEAARPQSGLRKFSKTPKERKPDPRIGRIESAKERRLAAEASKRSFDERRQKELRASAEARRRANEALKRSRPGDYS